MKLHPRVPLQAAAAAPSVDVFDRLPDDVVVRVLDLVSDVRSLARCRCLNRRFAALVAHAEHLHVAVDAVVSPSSSAPFFFSSSPTGSGLLFLIVPLLHRVLFSLLNSISALLYDDHKPPGGGARVVCGGAPTAGDEGRHGTKGDGAEPPSPSSAALLRLFRRVRTLRIELPAGDRPRISSKGATAGVLRWRAVFGSRLRSCVILAARAYGPMVDEEEGAYAAAGVNHHEEDLQEEEQAAATGLKERVIWTIGALIAASARHHMVREVVLGEKGGEMDELVVADRDREGVVMMAREGLGEWRKDEERRRHGQQQEEDSSSSSILLSDGDDPTVAERKGRTTVPAVRMTMRHVGRVDLGGGMQMRGAALVVVRAVGCAAATAHHSGLAAAAAAAPAPELLDDDKALVDAAFSEDDELMTAAQSILKRPSYLLEMNSF